jgi:phosphopantetheinyl transferase
LTKVSFNISHHGDWVILAGDTSLESTVRLGVDVMDFQEQVPGESFDTFSACFLDQVRVILLALEHKEHRGGKIEHERMNESSMNE